MKGLGYVGISAPSLPGASGGAAQADAAHAPQESPPPAEARAPPGAVGPRGVSLGPEAQLGPWRWRAQCVFLLDETLEHGVGVVLTGELSLTSISAAVVLSGAYWSSGAELQMRLLMGQIV